MTRRVLYTGDIFRMQPRGGITRQFVEIPPRLPRPHRVVVGFHISEELAGARLSQQAAIRTPEFTGAPRLRGLANRVLDAFLLRDAGDAIVHPTYYRNPSGLPRRTPIVATVHDMAHERFPELFRRRWWSAPDPARFKAPLCRRADRIVCVSEVTRSELVERFAIPEAKTRIIHPGIPDWSRVAAQPIGDLAGPFLMWVGERHTYKNFDATMRAWASAPEAAGTRLLCVGGPPFATAERAALAELAVDGRVRQRPLSEGELRWAYEHTAGLLYTSCWEGFGLPVLEALSLGAPVIASNAGAIPEIAGNAAILVDPADRDSLRYGIARGLTAGRDPAAVAARVEHAARFGWAACAAAHEALYRELD